MLAFIFFLKQPLATIDLRQVRDASEDLDWRFGNSLSVEGISMVRVKIATLYDRLST
jgi:hypothetical protein